LGEAPLGVGGRDLEGPPIVRQSIRRAAEAAQQVGAGGVQEVVLPQLRVEVDDGRRVAASTSPKD